MRKRNSNVAPEDARTLWDKARSSVESDFVVTARCTLITPMFGGGVKAGEVDRGLPIRASALRGQLRFWWRLLNGAGRNPTDLFIAESALWGGISSKGPRASQVTLQVKAAPADGQQLIAKSGLKSKLPNFPAYALDSGAGGQSRAAECRIRLRAGPALQANGEESAARAGHRSPALVGELCRRRCAHTPRARRREGGQSGCRAEARVNRRGRIVRRADDSRPSGPATTR